jgi:general L-amino acid transport system substrate-binding protein
VPIRRARALAKVLVPAAAALLAVAWAGPATGAGETITQVKSCGALRCGVSDGIAGFSMKDASGRWSGLDVDFCRAVAAAALGAPDKVTFVPLRASARLPALRLGAIDLLARDTTWTLAREAGLKVLFAGIPFYDGQAFMVPSASPVKSVVQLKGATVCVEKGTTHEVNLADYFGARGMSVTSVVIDSATEVADAFFAGRCRAYSSDASQLAAARVRAPAGRAFRILGDRISKEPLAPAARSGDDWLTLVRWVLFALVAAEEHGVTQKMAQTVRAGAVSAVYVLVLLRAMR